MQRLLSSSSVMHNSRMSDYKVVDTQFELRRDVVNLAQIVHAPIKQPTGEMKTVILSANISRHKSEKWGWSNGSASVLDSDGESWGGIVSVNTDDVISSVPSPKDKTADHKPALESIAAGLFERAIRVLTLA
jgi:hypothetical protein